MDGWVAGCQTRPIAEAHHKTHEYDVGSFCFAGDEQRKEGAARFHFNHVPNLLQPAGIQASSMHQWRDLSLASSLPAPVDRHRHLLMLMRANGWPVAAETTTLSHNPSFCHDFS